MPRRKPRDDAPRLLLEAYRAMYVMAMSYVPLAQLERARAASGAAAMGIVHSDYQPKVKRHSG